MRDQIVDFVRRWSEQSEIHAGRFIAWLGIAPSTFYSWRRHYGCVNEHNGWVARDFWLEEGEKQAILDFYRALSPTFPTFPRLSPDFPVACPRLSLVPRSLSPTFPTFPFAGLRVDRFTNVIKPPHSAGSR